MKKSVLGFCFAIFCLGLFALPSFADGSSSHSKLQKTLRTVVKENNGGFGFNMWATIVDRDGIVMNVAYSGNSRGDQWPGSR
ncbi:MAG: heme-binding protein, partial [bacterium]|nr:heme-binding protein [bacterium]